MDRSTVPGQVAGDCLLARNICVGGSSSIEKIAFTEYSDDGSIRLQEMFERMVHLLQDDDVLERAIAKSQRSARKKLSFEAITQQLASWRVLQ
jgi:hypothetical protein